MIEKNVEFSFWSEALYKDNHYGLHHPIFKEYPSLDKDVAYSDLLNNYKTLNLVFNEEYFEWIDILMSIKDSCDENYHFVELGSGFGRWGIRAAVNARYNGKIKDFFIEFAEAEPSHVKMNVEHCKINNINNFKLYDGLVSDRDGEDLFYINQPNGNMEDISIKWWGQAKVHDYEKIKREIGTYQNKNVYLLESGYQAISVRTYDIEEIANTWKVVDLVDMDVQGEEFIILNRSIKNFNNKVKRIHIGTHSVDVEKKIFKLLKDNEWINVRDYSCLKVNNTIFGDIKFVDGVQSWINPRFDVTYG